MILNEYLKFSLQNLNELPDLIIDFSLLSMVRGNNEHNKNTTSAPINALFLY